MAYGIHLGIDLVVIGYGSLVAVLYAVGHTATFHKFVNEVLYASGALGYLLNELEVADAQTLCLVGWEHRFHCLHIADELALIVGGDGDDMIHRQVAKNAGFYLHGLHVCLPFHFVARLKFLAGHYLGGFEHPYACLVEIALEHHGTTTLHVETAAACLFHPLRAISVAVEADGLAGLDILAQYVDDGACLCFALGNKCIHALLE